MKNRILVFVAGILCCGTWAIAQNTSPDTQPNPQGQTSGAPTTSTTTAGATSAMTVNGCLSESGGTYMLKSVSGPEYELTGNTSQLSPHVGHQVQITGSLASSTQTSGTNGPNTAPTSATSGASPTTVDVISVKHIASSCTNR